MTNYISLVKKLNRETATLVTDRPVKIGTTADKHNVEARMYQILKQFYGENFSREASLRKNLRAFSGFIDNVEEQFDIDLSSGLGKSRLKTTYNFREIVELVETLVARKGGGA